MSAEKNARVSGVDEKVSRLRRVILSLAITAYLDIGWLLASRIDSFRIASLGLVLIVPRFVVALVFLLVFVFVWLFSKKQMGGSQAPRSVGVEVFWIHSVHVQ